jgi:catalase (peroxidase I)
MSTICGLCLNHPLGVCPKHYDAYLKETVEGKDVPLPGYRMIVDEKDMMELQAKLKASKAEVRRMTIVARAGWESARALASISLDLDGGAALAHKQTVIAHADEILAALKAGAL